jgi:hypothetical protein
MSKGAKLITVPTQTQSQGGQGDRANNANASSIDSTTTDKTQSITPALPIGIKIKGPNINNNYTLNQTLIISGLPVATYTLTTVSPNDATYKIDSRQNTFEIQDANTMTEVATKICYSDTAYYENGMFKTLGPYSSGYYTMMTSATNRASQAISKAGISNIVYSGGTDRNSTYYATTAINFCQGTNSQDKSINGRSIVVSDGLLGEIWNNNYGSSLDQQRDTAAILNYKASEVVYDNELRNDSKASWSNIIHAINLEPDGDKILAYMSEASGISDFLPSDISVHPEKIYAMTVASLDNTTLLEMRCSQMSERGCNITKAMIQFANKTINNRNTYPAAIDISITPLNADRIARGVWLQSIFNHLSATQKWALKYAELIARIKRGGLGNVINAFNNWVDSLLGTRDTGNVTAFVFQGNQPVSTAIVTIGDEKVGYTDSTGRVSISGITTGTNTISVKNKNTGQDYNLETPGLTVNIVKNRTTSITIRLSQQ